LTFPENLVSYKHNKNMKNEMKNEKKTYTVYNRFSGDDAFTGTLEECNEWLETVHKLYPKAKKMGRWSDPI